MPKGTHPDAFYLTLVHQGTFQHPNHPTVQTRNGIPSASKGCETVSKNGGSGQVSENKICYREVGLNEI